jgi:PAS domain S-box-containing protein
MAVIRARRGVWWNVFLAVTVSVGLYLSSLYSYLLFHTLAELFSIVVALSIFVVAWNSRGFINNNYLLFFGIACLYVGAIDLLHTLAYKGMGVFPKHDANLPTQLWIAARYLQSASLFVAPWFLGRNLKLGHVFGTFTCLFVLTVLCIFVWGIFPACFVEGSGLTAFKKTSEYIVCLILLGAVLGLIARRKYFDRGVFLLLVSSIVVTIVSELSFTLYITVTGLPNLIGHYLKIIAFFLTYLAIVETGFRKPYRLLLRELKKEQDELELRVEERTAELKTTNKRLLEEIIEHQCTEERLRQASRRLEALSQVNQALIYAIDESALLHEVCRIIVEVGGYRMAWVGFVQADELRTVEPVAHAGFEDRYLETLGIALDGGNAAHGPMAQAIRTGETQIVRDVLADPSLAPWHEAARQREYASLITLPVVVNSHPIGGLAVWADRPDAFNEEELELLEHLGGDLSFGIKSLRVKAERERAQEALGKRTHELAERVKELDCLFGISRLLEIQGISEEEMIQRIADLIPPACRHPSIAAARIVLDGREVQTARFKDGPWKMTEAVSISGRHAGFVEVSYVEEIPESDEGPFLSHERALLGEIANRLGSIIESMRAEEALRASEERFRTVFEGAHDFIFIKDVSRKYTHVNPACERLFGLSASRVLGKTAEDFLEPEAAAYIRDVDARVLQGEWVEGETSRKVRGVPHTFHEVRVPMRNRAGEIVGLCGISRDITDWKSRETTPRETVHEYPSKVMRATLSKARTVAEKETTVLLLGESGSGKDYLARYIHEHSQRANGPFFSVNCAAVAPELAESELFGHERGAFTGAHGRKRGLLELAEGGTLLLNEIGELPLSLQAKLLTFLDTRQLTRVGGERSISVNARLIAATNRDLEKEVDAGSFRQDLFFRLNVVSLTVPPLRDRVEDIPILAEEILARLAADMQLGYVPLMDAATMKSLTQYQWPGNVRELRNVLERAAILWDGRYFDVRLPAQGAGVEETAAGMRFPEGRTLREVTDEVTRSMCIGALQRCGGNKKEAAKQLGIARDSLYRYLRQFGLES